MRWTILKNYLKPTKIKGLREISALGLAHVGDAVFELMVRTWLCTTGISTAGNLHSRAVLLVSAKAQAAAVDRIMPKFTDEELAVYKRGRNVHANSVPKGSTHAEYHSATGLETLFGYLYLDGNTDRLNEIFELILEG